jgi:glucose-6-phosphate 1-dehydrogenase
MPTPPKRQRFVLFGATGDLARRMLLPSLYGLFSDRLIEDRIEFICTARRPLSDEEYRKLAETAIREHTEPTRLVPEAIDRFLARLRYVAIDAGKPESFGALAALPEDAGANTAVFLSLAPSAFAQAIGGLRDAGLTGDNVVIGLEKPLGHDLASSQAINDAVAAAFSEDRIFRFDHYLGKETVQNLLAMRFGNRLFEPLWNATHVEHVQITVSETVGLEGRAGFYDETGALRDMVQSHILQLLALVAMEPPNTFSAEAVRDEKVKVFRALRTIDTASIARHCVIGQYQSGVVGGRAVAGYREELGRESGTETFVALKAHVDSWRWKGVPFYLRTGKRLPARHSEIILRFKPVSHSIFADNGIALRPNTLVIRLQPEESIKLLTMVKEPGLSRDGLRFREVALDLSLAFPDFRRRIAYERLLLDLLQRETTLFVRRDEIESQWRWIDAIRASWRAARMAPDPYAAGTWGPDSAAGLAGQDGTSWYA